MKFLCKIFSCSIHLLCFLSMVLLCVGCESFGAYNPATGRSEFIFISTPEEVAMGQGIHKNIKKEYRLAGDDYRVQRVRRIGQRLAQVSDRQDYVHQFYVVEKDELNAFTIPGGSVYVFTGLLDKLQTDDQIAGVLAHEIGHGAARHTIKKFQAALGYNLIGGLILSQVEEGQARQIAGLSSNALMGLVFSSYSRKDEFEADRLAVKYMFLADFNLNGMVETLEILENESKGSDVPLILKSHPHLGARIDAAKGEVNRVRDQFENPNRPAFP